MEPKISEGDYVADTEFAPMYKYLRYMYNELQGDDSIHRHTLLMAENFYLDGDYLCKVSLPRGRKYRRLEHEYNQICVPKKYRTELLKSYHLILSHYSVSKMHPALILKFYWKTLIPNIATLVKTCEICQCAKADNKPQRFKLHPLPVPRYLFQFISIDHKVMSRSTVEGNTRILVTIDHFSGYVIYSPVPTESAYDSAKQYIKDVVEQWGPSEIILSDKGNGYMSAFFKTVMDLLRVKHRSSAIAASRTNGAAERAIRSLNDGLKLYSTAEIDDTKLELLLPIIQMAVNASPGVHTGLSPFEITQGY